MRLSEIAERDVHAVHKTDSLREITENLRTSDNAARVRLCRRDRPEAMSDASLLLRGWRRPWWGRGTSERDTPAGDSSAFADGCDAHHDLKRNSGSLHNRENDFLLKALSGDP